MWTVLPRRTQRPISISRADIKTPKTKLKADRKTPNSSIKKMFKTYRADTVTRHPKMADLGLPYQALRTVKTAAQGQQPRRIPAAA
jgi:hypothetical protein